MQTRITLIGVTLGALFIGMAAAAAGPQTVVQGAFGGSSRIISPSVVAMWRARADVRSGPAILTFLVLWRGAPGWAVESESQTGGTSGMEPELRMFQRYGRHELTANVDAKARAITIQGKRIELGDANVVLVEDADQPDKTRVIKTLKVDGSMPDGSSRLEPVIRRVSELTEFLRCEARLKDPALQARMDAICAQFIK